jgi:hypothetical protein
VTKGGRDGEEVWLEKTYFTTEEAFPTVLRRSEVVAMEVLEISPIENALHEVELKTKELASLNLRYTALAKTAQVVSTNALSMCLNSAVDAPVDGGISSYRQIFFNPDYIARCPERTELVEKLRKAIDDQVDFSFVRQLSAAHHLYLHRSASSTIVLNFMGTCVRQKCFLSMRHWRSSSARISKKKSEG